ncbi:acetoacetyl-CoA synthetase [Parasteatoda tepidariorum]|uniref:acetoacetyl-CoA synthetase n=1 Tax=Parasteatoda tepidariorum TaxID=114398 RepID=UPI001C71C6C2|nr:acetoacetyl-CoA synthetase [Parasteatoda tepidariorum]
MSSDSRDFSSVPQVWKPDGKSGKNIRTFMKCIEDKYQRKFGDYWDFHQWTVDNIEETWTELWENSGIICSKKYEKVVDLSLPMTETKWFEGAKLNYAENLLKYRDDHIALILTGEDREVEKLTYSQLYEETKLYVAAFRKFGLRKGDIVMCFMSNRKEAILGMLATVSIGAIWTGALPQLGPEPVLNRMSQIKPKLLLTVDRFLFNGTEIDMLKKVKDIAEGLPSLEKIIIVASQEKSKLKDISIIKNSCFLDEFCELGRQADTPEIDFEQVSFSYPVHVNFTSGTTGLPKAPIYGCGLLMSVIRDYGIHMDAGRDDVYLSMSPVGWASWCFSASLLFLGQTVVLHEGFPYLLSPTYLWDMIDEFKITNLMIAPSTFEELEKKKYLPTSKNNLNSLRLIKTGGSVVKKSSFDFFYKELKLKSAFSAAYGSTEVMLCSTFDFNIPIYSGELPTSALCTLIECCDEITGEVIFGEVGDLVISKPSPLLISGLWGDEDGSKFRETYFTKYPGKFCIGDNGIINPVTKGLLVLGRSDATLKQRGCRFGSSEIYNVVDHFPEISDCLCVSQFNSSRDERAVLFLKLRDGYMFNQDLVKRIRKRIADDLTPRHVPDVILETKDIPMNTNGKKLELIVKRIINNLPVNLDSVSNPESLKCYQNRKELQDFK